MTFNKQSVFKGGKTDWLTRGLQGGFGGIGSLANPFVSYIVARGMPK